MLLRRIVKQKSVELQISDFGKVNVILKDYLDKNGITRNELSVVTGIKYQTIDRYYRNPNIERIDLNLIAKMCYSLNCDILDLIEYQPPQIEKS